MPDKHRAARELEKIGQHFRKSGHAVHHCVVDVGLFRNFFGDVALRVEQRGESLRDLAVREFRGAYLDGLDGRDVQPRSLEIEDDEGLAF